MGADILGLLGAHWDGSYIKKSKFTGVEILRIWTFDVDYETRNNGSS